MIEHLKTFGIGLAAVSLVTLCILLVAAFPIFFLCAVGGAILIVSIYGLGCSIRANFMEKR
jgi:hypothetical protein